MGAAHGWGCYGEDRCCREEADREIYPRAGRVETRNGQLLAGVIDNLLYQKPEASISEVTDALSYVDANDTVLDF